MVSHALTTLLTRVLLASSMLSAAEPNLATSDLTAGMDTSIPPGDDFFSYANGNWLKNASIPPDRSSFGVFQQLIERSEKQVAQLIRDTGESAHAQSPVARQVADYYNSVMDEGRIEAKGLSPVQPTLQRIEAIKDGVTLASWPGKFGRQ